MFVLQVLWFFILFCDLLMSSFCMKMVAWILSFTPHVRSKFGICLRFMLPKYCQSCVLCGCYCRLKIYQFIADSQLMVETRCKVYILSLYFPLIKAEPWPFLASRMACFGKCDAKWNKVLWRRTYSDVKNVGYLIRSISYILSTCKLSTLSSTCKPSKLSFFSATNNWTSYVATI